MILFAKNRDQISEYAKTYDTRAAKKTQVHPVILLSGRKYSVRQPRYSIRCGSVIHRQINIKSTFFEQIPKKRRLTMPVCHLILSFVIKLKLVAELEKC